MARKVRKYVTMVVVPYASGSKPSPRRISVYAASDARVVSLESPVTGTPPRRPTSVKRTPSPPEKAAKARALVRGKVERRAVGRPSVDSWGHVDALPKNSSRRDDNWISKLATDEESMMREVSRHQERGSYSCRHSSIDYNASGIRA